MLARSSGPRFLESKGTMHQATRFVRAKSAFGSAPAARTLQFVRRASNNPGMSEAPTIGFIGPKGSWNISDGPEPSCTLTLRWIRQRTRRFAPFRCMIRRAREIAPGDLIHWSLVYLISEWAIRLVMLSYVPPRRSAAAARSWLLLIFLLPWPGLLLYLLIGRIRLPKTRLEGQER